MTNFQVETYTFFTKLILSVVINFTNTLEFHIIWYSKNILVYHYH